MDRPKSSAAETLTDLMLEFLEAVVHEFLFAWQVYPREAFESRVLYDVPIHMSRHPLLCEYVHSMLAGCRTWLMRGELEKLCVILLSKEGRTVETLVIEPGWSAAFIETAAAEEDQPLPLVQLEEAFRAGMVALVATPVTNEAKQTDSRNNQPHTFRILAQTVEDAANHGTCVDETNAANSWVLADPFWCEDQKKPKEIFPVKTIQSQASPIRLNVYLEKQQTATAVTNVE
ncbi:MAD2 mitotic arrest deficient-like 2 [Phytophthora ramorum]|uniref:Mitotic spindle assembly checkpoint protein MAD2B n=1 Tax=Phytophthora ramorum TaxID=164328 RepID=UPI0030AF7A8D|nr:Mitotic spindle assembly checkpoint protein MAD2B [Phytophthora ramorum]KAH7508896.1 Mitotic spindle assembly checkpoint protein MAD2B [Phytophthora ramorum]